MTSCIKRSSLAAGLAVFVLTAPTLSFAAECYNPNDARDKFLKNMVTWVPAKGTKGEFDGKTYSQSQGIKFAIAHISKGFSDRGGSVKQSAAGLSAISMIQAKNNVAKAEKRYLRATKKAKNSNGNPITVSFADASVCWTRMK
jgi:hypothetical protein